jgi:hypothetical protein
LSFLTGRNRRDFRGDFLIATTLDAADESSNSADIPYALNKQLSSSSSSKQLFLSPTVDGDEVGSEICNCDLFTKQIIVVVVLLILRCHNMRKMVCLFFFVFVFTSHAGRAHFSALFRRLSALLFLADAVFVSTQQNQSHRIHPKTIKRQRTKSKTKQQQKQKQQQPTKPGNVFVEARKRVDRRIELSSKPSPVSPCFPKSQNTKREKNFFFSSLRFLLPAAASELEAARGELPGDGLAALKLRLKSCESEEAALGEAA